MWCLTEVRYWKRVIYDMIRGSFLLRWNDMFSYLRLVLILISIDCFVFFPVYLVCQTVSSEISDVLAFG
jgi:hypothetical protein